MFKKGLFNVYFVSILICLLFTFWGILPKSWIGEFSLATVTSKLQVQISSGFGWFYSLSMTVILIIAIFLLFSKYGKIKLGKDTDEPQFSYISWIAMLFSAGMGIGLIFWGVAEPLMHFYDPAIPSQDLFKNARQSLVYSFFHWGLHPWALYAMVGLIIAYNTFRKGKPAIISESVTSIFPERVKGKVKFIVDVLAIIATAFGVATSLGFGAQQITGGLNYLNPDIPNNFTIQLIVILLVTVLYLISATTGLDKGVKILSNTNILLAICLMLFILFMGPTSFLLDTFTQTLGSYFQSLPNISLRMAAFDEGNRNWINVWTVFYWSWWISWSPYVGSFIARISKGRTIREFISGVLIIPTFFSFLWFSVFGGTAIWADLFGNKNLISVINLKGTETGLFALLEIFGAPGKIIIGVAILLISTFFITSADSATYVLAMFSTKGNLTPPPKTKLVWGIIQSSIAIVLLYAGGLASLQSVAILVSLPFIFVIILMIINFFNSILKEENL